MSATQARAGFPFRQKPRSKQIATALLALIALLLLTQPGCSLSMSLGQKSRPAAPVSPATAQNLHTTITVPPEAQRISEGTEPVSYVADIAGTVYVFSRDDRQVSLQYNLEPGETFTLTPADDGTTFTADRHTGAPGHGTLPPSKGGYEVYFLRKGTPTTSPATAPTLP